MESQVSTWSMRLKVPLTRGVGDRNRLPVSPTAPAGAVFLPAVVGKCEARAVGTAGFAVLAGSCWLLGSDEGLGGGFATSRPRSLE